MHEAATPPGATETSAALLALLVAAAQLAGEVALADFRPGEPARAKIKYKGDGSPVSEADLAVDRLLADTLRPAFPEAGWLSEETADSPDRLGRARVLVVDPIDGTRAFVSGDPGWTVAIAMIENGRPIAGVIHAPALGETFTALLGEGAACNGVALRTPELATLDGALVAGPKSLIARFSVAANFAAKEAPPTRSLAYRFANVASGRFAIGLASANSQDWDIAAADLILREAGAGLLEGGALVSYNQSDTRHGFLLAAPGVWLASLAPALDASSRKT